MFWKMCGTDVNGACPIQFAPSPPICVTASVRRSGIHAAMPWQPMPPSATEPSGTTVEVLCGQPEQNAGSRVSWPGGAAVGAGGGGRRRAATPGAALSSQRAERLRHDARRELALGRHERRARGVALAGEARALALVVEQARELVLDHHALLFDHEHVARARGRSASAPSGSSGHDSATL